jgi:hypothetical protein
MLEIVTAAFHIVKNSLFLSELNLNRARIPITGESFFDGRVAGDLRPRNYYNLVLMTPRFIHAAMHQ